MGSGSEYIENQAVYINKINIPFLTKNYSFLKLVEEIKGRLIVGYGVIHLIWANY